jgi:hypothetical protein
VISGFLANNGHPANVVKGTGITGEALFALGGAWQAGSAGYAGFKELKELDVVDAIREAGPEALAALLDNGVHFLKGLANLASGITGLVAQTSKTPVVGQVSSGLWGGAELVNLTQHLAQLCYATRNKPNLGKDEMVNLGQFVGSALKFSGIVWQLSGKSGNAPIITQTVGIGTSIGSGLLNLQNKGYFNEAFQSAEQFVSDVNTFLGRGGTQVDPESGMGAQVDDALKMEPITQGQNPIGTGTRTPEPNPIEIRTSTPGARDIETGTSTQGQDDEITVVPR